MPYHSRALLGGSLIRCWDKVQLSSQVLAVKHCSGVENSYSGSRNVIIRSISLIGTYFLPVEL